MEAGYLWVWRYGPSGAGMEAWGRWRWSGADQEASGRWVAWEKPLEIGDEAPLEVVVGELLELVGERDRTGWALARNGVASSGRSRRFG